MSICYGDGNAEASNTVSGKRICGVAHRKLATAPGHPFYERLNAVLEAERFDEFVEGRCAKFYAARHGRPSLTPGIYFCSLLIGYFEGIGAERGIAWRLAESRALRRFVGIGLDEYTPDHYSTISRTRRLGSIWTRIGKCSALGAGRAGRPRTAAGASGSLVSMRRRWKPTRPCVRSCDATRERATRSFCAGWPRLRASKRRPWRGLLARVGPQQRKKAFVEHGVEEPCGRGCAGGEDEGRAHALGAQASSTRSIWTPARWWR